MGKFITLFCFLAVFAAAPLNALSADYAIDIHKKDMAFQGTTIFAETIDPGRPRIVEMDMNGKVVWDYVIPQKLLRGGKPGQAMDVEWIPSTDTILFVVPFKGIFEVDRNKEIVWEHLTTRVSHDADRLPNGNTLFTFAWERQSDPQVTEITPDGTVVWQWSANDHITPDKRHHKGSIGRDGFAHVNGTIRLENGLTRISLRNFSTVVEVDRNGDIVWAMSKMENGKRIRNVHDPRTLENGNILLSIHGPQIIFELTRDGRIVRKLRSPDIHLVRAHQVLPNGNILASDVDKIMEFSPDLSEIVWQCSKSGVNTSSLAAHDKTSKRQKGPRKGVDPRENGFYKARRIPPQ